MGTRMFKKLLLVVALLLIPVALASAASAAPSQYPPSTAPGSGTGSGGAGTGSSGYGTTLARSGSNNGPLVLVGVALVSVGGIALVTSRRMRTTD